MRMKFGLVVFTVLALAAGAAQAQQGVMQPPQQQQTPAANLFNRNVAPLDINNVPVLADLVRNGAKLYFLGVRSGLYGWFIVKQGQIQMIYVTADGQSAVMGGLFTNNGENVTGPQITALSEANKEVADLINNAGRQQAAAQAGGLPGGVASLPPVPQTPATPGVAAPTVEPQKPQPNAVPIMPLSPGEQLLQDLNAAAGVTLGANEDAQIAIVIDPNCPYCQQTWKELRDSVFKNRVQVRLIPISLSGGGEDARAAARLLVAANPLEAWDQYVAGNHAALAGEADPIRAQAVLANKALVDKWNIQSTPYLVYRAKDGHIKIVQGKPDRMPAVLADLLK